MNKLFSMMFNIILIVSLNATADIGDLQIDGNISNKNHENKFILKADDFDKMKKTTIKTTTSWTQKDRQIIFQGVKVEDILKIAGARGKTLRMSALNDYWVDIPITDVNTYGIILADTMDGKKLKTRNFGPYFVIYPLDDYPTKLNSPTYLSRFIWQVNRITVLQ